MSAIVPWATPGGTPCCCSGNCFTDLVNDPLPFYATNRWQVISQQTYAQLLAGGSYTGSISVDVDSDSVGWFDGSIRGETHTANVGGLIYSTNNADPCSFTGQSQLFEIDVQGYAGAVGTYSQFATFSRHLATFNNLRWLNLSTITASGVQTLLQLVRRFSSLWFGEFVGFYVANADQPSDITQCNNRKFTGATSEVRLTVDGITYTEFGGSVGCFISSTSSGLITHSGSVVSNVVFTPSAP
jgi:hypothetical protein